MSYEKGPELSGARLEDADFSNARLHAPNFEGVKITDAWFSNADISGDLEGLRLNGVEVAPLVAAERERLFPELMQLQAADPRGLAEAWAMIEAKWQVTVSRAAAAFRGGAQRSRGRRVELRRDAAPPRPRDRLLAPANGEGDRAALPPLGACGVVAQRSRRLGARSRREPVTGRSPRRPSGPDGRGRAHDRRPHARGAGARLRSPGGAGSSGP